MGRKHLFEYFKWQSEEIAHKKTKTWYMEGKPQKSSTNNAIKTNYIEAEIDNTQKNSKCWLCGDKDEMINRVSECNKLA